MKSNRTLIPFEVFWQRNNDGTQLYHLPVPLIVADIIHSLLTNFTHTRYWSPGLAPGTTRDPEFPDSLLPNLGSHSATPTFTKPYTRSTVISLMEMGC